MDALNAFLLARYPEPLRVLKMALRPFSIGHRMALLREQNRILCGGDVRYVDLLRAVLICSLSHEEWLFLPSDPAARLKVWIWSRRLVKRDWSLDLAVFVRYLQEGSAEPVLFSTGGGGRACGAPWLLRLQQFLVVHLRLSEAEAMDYPLALACWQWAAHWEEQGSIRIQNESEKSLLDFAAEQDSLAATDLKGGS